VSPIQRRDGRVAARYRAFSNPTTTVAAELVVNLALLAVVSLLAGFSPGGNVPMEPVAITKTTMTNP
jgi:hypothetical protein